MPRRLSRCRILHPHNRERLITEKKVVGEIAVTLIIGSMSAKPVSVRRADKPHNRENPMSALKSGLNAALALLCLAVSCTQASQAQNWIQSLQAQELIKDPTTWWPDPSTGLMWTGQTHAGPSTYPKVAIMSRSQFFFGLSWRQANDYCASLHVGDFAGWRVPTLDEVKDAIVVIRVERTPA